MDDILAIGGFFTTIIVIVIGLPLVKAYVRKQERMGVVSPGERERDERLARMETAIESMAVEIERISEGQRFVTRLLAERESAKVLPAVEERR